MHTKHEIVEALKKQYIKGLGVVYGDSKEMPYEAADELLSAIEEIAADLGVLKEIQQDV